MKVVTLLENTTCRDDLICEHGLSLFIETADKRILFDAGQTDAFAKNAAALREMNDIIKLRQIEKIYLAAVHGVPTPKSGEIKLKLEKDSKENIVKVRNDSKNAKVAITKYNTVALSRNSKFALVEIELITGRTHQIRASFAHIGNPLVGDGKYAINKIIM